MSNYRRSREGTSYFFTVVTYGRRPLLCLEPSRPALRGAIEDARRSFPFTIDAWVLLPDHLHCVWTLPEGDSDYSIRWALIKKGFTARAKAWAEPVDVSASRKKHREGGLWQRRFWEHTIRNERDFVAHCDYVHWNPVKHGLAAAPKDWPWSTFHRCVVQGLYPREWGAEPITFEAGVGRE